MHCKTGVQTDLSGPEQVFQIKLSKPVANFGAVVLSHAKGVRVSPRVVVAGDENRLLGNTALPVNLNPYQDYGRIVPAVGAVSAKAGSYDFVFDTPVGGKPGKFTFRVWVNDVTPPKVRLLTPSGPRRPAGQARCHGCRFRCRSGVDYCERRRGPDRRPP